MANDTYTIEKSTVEVYKIRQEKGYYWADITIDEQVNSGRIQIASDFGSWQNYWGACGHSFKEFLMQINMQYAADKFGVGKHFDHDGTINLYMQLVAESSARGDISEENTRKLFDDIKIMENSSYTNEEVFRMGMYDRTDLMAFFDHGPELLRTITPVFKMFWEGPWKGFINQLDYELKSIAR